jgi:WD40 repeat protein
MIAISYRREDSLPIAGRLYDRLQAKFGKKNVFMDFDSIPPGADFHQHIKQMIERSKLVIAIIGPHWVGEKPDASRRIDNPADFVRLEIAYALEGGIPIIPLLINTTQMPKPEMLPPDIQDLAFRHALPLDSGMDFHSHVDRLITGIHKAMALAPRSGRLRKLSKPTASAVDTRPLRKIVNWSAAILLAVAASGFVLWYVATHTPQPAKRVTIANRSNGPIAASAATSPVVGKPVQRSSLPEGSEAPKETALITAPSPTAVELLTLNVGANVYSVAFSPDGTRIVTGSDDGTARVWDAQSGKELLTLSTGSSSYSVAFSPDGRRIATGSADATARVWDAQSGRVLLTLGHSVGVSSVAFSPDGTRIATASYDATKVWDGRNGKELLTLEGRFSEVHSVAFSPDGRRIATGSGDATARVWDAQSGKVLLTLRLASIVNSLAFSPDGARIAIGSTARLANVWDAQSGKKLLTLSEGSIDVKSVVFSPDGTRIATDSYDDTAKVWDAQSGKELLTLKGHSNSVNSVGFSPDG